MKPMCLTVQIHLAFTSKEKSTLGLRARVLEGLKSRKVLFHLNSNIAIFVR